MKPKKITDVKIPAFESGFGILPDAVTGTDDQIAEMTGFAEKMKKVYKETMGTKEKKGKKGIDY